MYKTRTVPGVFEFMGGFEESIPGGGVGGVEGAEFVGEELTEGNAVFFGRIVGRTVPWHPEVFNSMITVHRYMGRYTSLQTVQRKIPE